MATTKSTKPTKVETAEARRCERCNAKIVHAHYAVDGKCISCAETIMAAQQAEIEHLRNKVTVLNEQLHEFSSSCPS